MPIVWRYYQPQTVVDLGCGEGWWRDAFRAMGAVAYGVDQTREADFRADLTKPLPHIGTFDLAVCLEVAEHLPQRSARLLIAELCELAPVVLFSAAIPGQGGVAHLNEQWPDYWTALFGEHGYSCSGALRWIIWNDHRIENWYRQNLIVAARDPSGPLFDTPLMPVWPVVHPVLYDARR